MAGQIQEQNCLRVVPAAVAIVTNLESLDQLVDSTRAAETPLLKRYRWSTASFRREAPVRG